MGLVLTWWKLQSLSVRRAYSASPLAGADRAVIPLAVLVLLTRIGADTWQLCQAWTSSQVARPAIETGMVFLGFWTLGLLAAVVPFLAGAWRSGSAFPPQRLHLTPVSGFSRWWGDRGGIFSQGAFWGLWALALGCLVPGFLTIFGSGAWILVPGVLAFLTLGLLFTLIPGNPGKVTGFLLMGLLGAVLANPQFSHAGGQFSLQVAGAVIPLEHPVVATPAAGADGPGSPGFNLPGPGTSEARGWSAALLGAAAFLAFLLRRGRFNRFRLWGASSVRFFLSPRGLQEAFPPRDLWDPGLLVPYAGASVLAGLLAGPDGAALALALGLFQTVLTAWTAPLASLHLPSRENGDSPALVVFGLPVVILIILGVADLRGLADGSVVRWASVFLTLGALGGLVFYLPMRRRLVLDWEQQMPTVLNTFQE